MKGIDKSAKEAHTYFVFEDRFFFFCAKAQAHALLVGTVL